MIAIQNGAKPSVVSKNQIKKIPSRNGGVINSSQFIPARIISAMNRNENVNQNGHPSISFPAAICFMKNQMPKLYPNFKVLETIENKNIVDMSTKD
jgi:hypothetical protein